MPLKIRGMLTANVLHLVDAMRCTYTSAHDSQNINVFKLQCMLGTCAILFNVHLFVQMTQFEKLGEHLDMF